eukprot:m.305866 g.305866  ORF g.305866 m.305866 type:complete len:51 (+) comp16343_c2_seq2:587-739(+)
MAPSKCGLVESPRRLDKLYQAERKTLSLFSRAAGTYGWRIITIAQFRFIN